MDSPYWVTDGEKREGSEKKNQPPLKINGENYIIALYNYSKVSIALSHKQLSDEEEDRQERERFKKFCLMYKSHFKETAGGKYNPNLTICGNKCPGWIFKVENHKLLTDVLKKIFTGEIKPKELEATAPDFSQEDVDLKVVTLCQELKDLLPENGNRVISEDDTQITTIYYGDDNDESVIKQGEPIFSFTSAHRTVEICQLKK